MPNDGMAAPEAAPEQAAVSTPEGGTAAPDGGSTPQPEAKPERTFTQAELDDILEKRLAKERQKRVKLQQESEVFRRIALEREGRQAEPRQAEPQPQDGRPKRESFTDYEDYIEALADHKAQTRIREVEQQRTQQMRQQQLAQQMGEAQRAHLERQDKARTKYEDYDEVALDNSVPINDAMAHAIVQSDMGPDIAYYLGKNREEAQRISRLPPLRAVIELGKIEAKLALSPQSAAPTSRAPAPINPVGGSGKASVPSEHPNDKDDVKTWLEKRNRQLHGKG